MPNNFVDHSLNIIVKHVTGISYFFNKHEMDMNAMGFYFGDKTDKGSQRQRIGAEKKVNINVCFVLNSSIPVRLFDI